MLLLGAGDERIAGKVGCNGGLEVAQTVIDGQMQLLRGGRGRGGRMKLQMLLVLLARRLHLANVHEFLFIFFSFYLFRFLFKLALLLFATTLATACESIDNVIDKSRATTNSGNG